MTRRRLLLRPEERPDREAVLRAEAEAVLRAVSVIVRAASAGDWQAAAWFLEHRHPEWFGAPRRVIVAGDPDAPVTVGGLVADDLDPLEVGERIMAEVERDTAA